MRKKGGLEDSVDFRLAAVTLRVLRTGDHLLWAEDWILGVVGEDSNTSFQHPHGGKGVAAPTRS